jgi:hypothetical protein
MTQKQNLLKSICEQTSPPNKIDDSKGKSTKAKKVCVDTALLFQKRRKAFDPDYLRHLGAWIILERTLFN